MLAILALAALCPKTISAGELVRRILTSGDQHDLCVKGDVDLGRLRRTTRLSNVTILGTMKGAPRHTLSIQGGTIEKIDAEDRIWTQPVEMFDTSIGTLLASRATLASFRCRHCVIGYARFAGAMVKGELDLSQSRLGKDRATSFADAVFVGAARFDDVTLLGGQGGIASIPSFAGAQFADSVRFTGLTAPRGIDFTGALFAKSVAFSRCDLKNALFGTGEKWPYAGAEFAESVDFSGCVLRGMTVFDGTIFRGNVSFTGVRFSGLLSLRAIFPAQTLDFRGATGAKGARLLFGPIAAEAARLSGRDLENGLVDEAAAANDTDTLDALARSFRDQNEPRAALIAAQATRRIDHAHPKGDTIARLLADAEWWLWALPTEGGSNPLRPIGVLVALFVGVAALGTFFGRFAWMPPGAAAPVRPFEPVFRTELAEGKMMPAVGRNMPAALSFAGALLLKVDPIPCRWLAKRPGGSVTATTVALWLVWLCGWALIALSITSLIASAPGTSALLSGFT